MIYALQFNVTGDVDASTVVNLPIPVAADATGMMVFNIVGNFGIIDPAMLQPLVGPGGYLLCGIGFNLSTGANVIAGMIGRTAGSVGQRFPTYPQLIAGANQPTYVERPAYVPPFYQLYFSAPSEDPGEWVVRIDIAPLRTVRQAARALRVVRPNLFATPAAGAP